METTRNKNGRKWIRGLLAQFLVVFEHFERAGGRIAAVGMEEFQNRSAEIRARSFILMRFRDVFCHFFHEGAILWTWF